MGKGPRVGSGRSSEPAGGTGQTGEKVGSGERAPTGGDGKRGAQQGEATIVHNTGVLGYQRAEPNAARIGGTTVFQERARRPLNPKPHRPGIRVAERGSMSAVVWLARTPKTLLNK